MHQLNKHAYYIIPNMPSNEIENRWEGYFVMHQRRYFLVATQAFIMLQLVTGFQPIIRNTLQISIVVPKRQENASLHSFRSQRKFELQSDDYDEPPPAILYEDGINFSQDELERLTVSQLKQQLRLRGLKVGGNKSDLIMRLVGGRYDNDAISESIASDDKKASTSKAKAFAQSRGKELIDVSDYLDEDDKSKETRTLLKDKEIDNDEADLNKSRSPETWGEEAKIVDDFEGRSVIVDNLSRTVVEFKGSTFSWVQAYVVASRDSLKTFLAGGDRANSSTDLSTAVKNIQNAREKANKVPMRLEDQQGEDVDDEEGFYTNILDRDYGDYGDFSMTGAELSAQEVKGVLLLSDVHGPFTSDTKMLAEKIAFECQPVVVFAPDLFRGNPWKEDSKTGLNDKGETYEEWRACHPDQRVSVDIRAAAAALREQYGVSSISLFGQCFGGGRALEATARSYPNDSMDDIRGEMGPPHGKIHIISIYC